VTSSSKNVADAFIKSMRKGDVAGRFGGEEFLLVMHGADRQHAVDRAEKLRGAIRSIEATFSGQKLDKSRHRSAWRRSRDRASRPPS
jgi:diguanylate cyclase (GGDEF)-like protein